MERGEIDTLLEAASIEDDVPKPPRRRSSSFASVLSDLRVGETAARAQVVDPALTVGDFAAQSVALREALRNNCAPAVRQARGRTGGEYSIEIADVMTPSRRLFLVALVTRIS